MEQIDCAVIGAGVVGLAVARALALSGREVVILEKERSIGTGASARNSAVIHAGIYYPKGSLKARLCVSGRHALYAYCATRGIAHQVCGKLIVATHDSQVESLQAIAAQGIANGVEDLQWLSGTAAIRALEPALHGVAAVLSPSTGIIDSHALMLALLGDAEAAGAVLALSSPVKAGVVRKNYIVLRVGEQRSILLRARTVVNSAGLWAPNLARSFKGLDFRRLPRGYLAKGSYFSLAASHVPFRRLIYPLPDTASLGIHFTRDLMGYGRFGPDVEWVDSLDYSVKMERISYFYTAIRRYWPALSDDSLQPGYAGIRPKIHGPGESVQDFVIDWESGNRRFINLFGIESPGLTACLALAEMVVALSRRQIS